MNNTYEDYLTVTANGLDVEANNVTANCITSGNNTFSMDSSGNLVCNSVTTNQGQTINYNQIYPVGAIYLSVNDTNPGTIFTGTTWTKITDTFLIGAGNSYSLGATGGALTHTHTSAAHSHSSAAHSHGEGSLSAAINFDAQNGIYTQWTTSRGAFTATGLKASSEIVNSSSSYRTESTVVYGSTGETTPGPTGVTTPGDTGASSSMPPYLAVNIWKRIS